MRRTTKVDTEHMKSTIDDIGQCINNLQNHLSKLEQIIISMEDEWKGPSKDLFDEQFEKDKLWLNQYLQSYSQYNLKLVQVQEKYKKVEQETKEKIILKGERYD